MVDASERKKPWPRAALIIFVLGVGAVVFFGYYAGRGQGVLGLDATDVWTVGALSWLACMTLSWLLVKRANDRSE